MMQASSSGIYSSVDVLTLNKGIYVFTVKSAAPRRVGEDSGLVLPAVHVGLGPGVAENSVDFMSGLRNGAGWLFEARDVLVVRVNVAGAHLLITSIRAEGMPPLGIDVERMDNRRPANPLYSATPAGVLQGPQAAPQIGLAPPAAAAPALNAINGQAILRTQVNVHLPGRGAMAFSDGWAGAVGDQMGIEAIAIFPLEGFPADRIQYKALSANGHETPWTSGGAVCGVKGGQTLLIGFAIRLAMGAEAEYDVFYRGMFRSGAVVGPLTNGQPCQVSGTNEPLDAIEVSVVRKASRAAPGPAAAAPRPAAPEPAPRTRPIGPKFSVFREEGP